MTAIIPSATLLGVDGTSVSVEVHLSNGLPSYTVVGLPDAPCRESRDRVRAALLSSGFKWSLKRVTVNLAPSGLRKGGPGLDLPIAIGLLVEAGELEPEAVAGCGFVGELGLDGSIRRVTGVVPLVAAICSRVVVVPPECFAEAAVVGRHKVRVAATLAELVAALRGQGPWPDPPVVAPGPIAAAEGPDLADVRGQAVGRLAVEVSAAGGHHLLFSGPPGAGKTMLARRLPGLLPALDGDDALTATRIHSAAGVALPAGGLVVRPPFRAPHHGASAVALIGGGSGYMRPGEISLSHPSVRQCYMSHALPTTDAAPVRAALYCRISSDPQGLRAGVGRQEDDCRTYCAAHRYVVADVFVDNDVSAYSGKARPQYRRMLNAIEAGELDAVVVWHPDRLHRSPSELEEFIVLVERTGCAVGTVTAGNYDLATPSGRMTARVVGAVARGESEHKSERIRRKAKQLAEDGKVGGGGTRPFGFEQDRLTVREAEAKLIRQAAQDILSGVTVRTVARDWNTAEIKTPTGRTFLPATVDRIVRSARIAGQRSHHGTVVAKAEWPAIIDRQTWEAVRAVLGEKRRLPGQNARKYLLAGYVYCGLCETGIVARPRQNGIRAYVCAKDPGRTGCGKIRRLANPVEALVSQAVIEALTGPGTAKALQERSSGQEDVRGLVESLEGFEARLVALEADYMDGGLDLGSWKRMKAGLEERITEARKALAQKSNKAMTMNIPVGVRLEDWWETASLDRRRALVQTVVEKVIIHPAMKGRNFFDPSKIEIIWKD